jgi:hypothetical protein
MRTAALHPEQRRIVNGGLVDLAGVQGDQLADHLEMTKFLDGDILQHVADAGIFYME